MIWTRISARLRQKIRYKVTRGGFLFFAALLGVAAAAAVSANNLLFLILAAMMATLLVSGLISRLVLAGLELEMTVPEHVSARSAVPARFRLRNVKRWMPSFSIQVSVVPAPGDASPPALDQPIYFAVIPGGSCMEEATTVTFPRRGANHESLFVFATTFPFGFIEKKTSVTLRKDTLVYPCVDNSGPFENVLAGIRGEMSTNLQGIGRDFHRIRPYQASESARYVDWKSTAHSGELQVREFEREQQRTVEIFLDRNIERGEEAWFEFAVECCAYLVWNLRETGLRFRSQRADLRVPEDADAYTILKFLALVEAQTGKSAEPPTDDANLQILLSPFPERFVELGWRPAHVVGPGAMGGGDVAGGADAGT